MFKFSSAQHGRAKILVKQYWGSVFETRDCLIFRNFDIWYSILFCLYLSSLISYRKVFVLQTELWIPPFKWIMSQPSRVFMTREIKQKLRYIFLWTPCIIEGKGDIFRQIVWQYIMSVYRSFFLSRQFLKSLDVHFYVVLLTASGKQQIRPSLLNMELPLEQKDLDYQ